MIEERLNSTLLNLGYTRVDTNVAGIYFFSRLEESSRVAGASAELFIIAVIHAIDGNELTKEQYCNILEQIKKNQTKANSYPIRLLSLILTASLKNARQLCLEQPMDNHWIIDVASNQLILYENQVINRDYGNEFGELKEKIELFLQEELLQRQELGQYASGYPASVDYDIESQAYRKKYKIFTPINTSIVILNLLAFLLTYVIPVFGGKNKILSFGALSWYLVWKEGDFYRLLTSMFLHADVSHIFNNMLVLLFVGDKLEREVGKLKYLILYFVAGILAGITSISYNMWKEYSQLPESSTFSIGASGAIFGVIGAMLFIIIANRGRLEDISARQMAAFVILSLYSGIVNTRVDMAAHIGGFLAGFLLAALIYRRPRRNMSREAMP